MNERLKKALRITCNILFYPSILFCIYGGVLEIAGYPFMDDLLASAQLPITAQQVSNIGFVTCGLWILCFFGILGLNQKKENAASEAAEIARVAYNFDPNRSDTPLRRAETGVKNRVFLEKTMDTYHICYRRIGKNHELIVNGEVYAEISTKWEQNHELKALVKGHEIRAGYKKEGYSYLIFDGKTVAKKLRVFF